MDEILRLAYCLYLLVGALGAGWIVAGRRHRCAAGAALVAALLALCNYPRLGAVAWLVSGWLVVLRWYGWRWLP